MHSSYVDFAGYYNRSIPLMHTNMSCFGCYYKNVISATTRSMMAV
ncbi:hypothetical protein APS_0823 [Acetobacter pasteurianus subsp. pasteurianus LMG 1262 = NBRC 106471]|nr:hypothetical protein APS_0823 [Acetobacter pasteurianus subsp. pasteurianus LMG 1262 = NBRC 106471]